MHYYSIPSLLSTIIKLILGVWKVFSVDDQQE